MQIPFIMAKIPHLIHTIQVDQCIICHAGVLVYHLMMFILVPSLHMIHVSECPRTPNKNAMGDFNVFPQPAPSPIAEVI